MEGVTGVEFRILGSVEAVGDDGPLPLGAPKQRALLALLLLHATRSSRATGSSTRCGETTRRARRSSSLQVYVHGLRRVLGPERIETHGTGYRLRLDPGELDLAGSTGSSRLAAGARGRARPGRRTEDLARAPWRSGSARRSPTSPASPSRRRTQPGSRRAACARSSSATTRELALGRDDEPCRSSSGSSPPSTYRERFRVQQVLALYRSGRQKDALEAYRDARERARRGARHRSRPGAAGARARDPAPGRVARGAGSAPGRPRRACPRRRRRSSAAASRSRRSRRCYGETTCGS